MNLVLLETSGNQRYIFATNKLRENVGASELTYRVGTKTVLQAVKEVAGIDLLPENDLDGSKLRATLLDPTKNRPIGQGNKVEVIVATSGKAILLVDDDENKTIGGQIIREVTQTALREMPGLIIHGAISESFESLDETDENGEFNVHQAIGYVHRKLEEIRYQMPSNEQRFLRLPFFAPCSTSGLPASHIKKYEEDNEPKLFSSLSYVKRETRNKGYKRIRGTLEGFNLIQPEHMEERSWTAIIHADGNGLGRIFLNFNQYAGKDEKGIWTGRKYLNDYRKFSLALDVCTEKATRTALEHLRNFEAQKEARRQNKGVKDLTEEELKELKLPVVPIVLGGDDLTVLCDGEYALRFTNDFLVEFEYQTEQSHELVGDIVKQIAGKVSASGKNYLGICAGIAIVKPHFPFHQAYKLAESLLRSAKDVKQKITTAPSSAMDFHILYDSAYSDLDLIRENLRVDGEKTHLYAKPYVVTDEEKLASEVSNPWLTPRKFSELEKRVEVMRARDKDDASKRALPNSQLHGLREALFLGWQEADARMSLIKQRYEDKDFDYLLCESQTKDEKSGPIKSLFFEEKGNDNQRATHFLDALDVVGFWKGFPNPKSKSDSTKQPDNGDKENE
jgi:hypothetical protein